LSSDRFIFCLGFGFLFTAVIGMSFELPSELIFGFSLFAFIITLSQISFLSDSDREKIKKGSILDTLFDLIKVSVIVAAIPISVGLPVLINELFVEPNDFFTRFSSYITIFSIGLILIMRKAR